MAASLAHLTVEEKLARRREMKAATARARYAKDPEKHRAYRRAQHRNRTPEQRDRINASQRRFYARLTPEQKVERNAYARAREAALCPSEKLRAHLRKHYKITLDDYHALWERQQHRCGACGDVEPQGGGWVVDHCHESGRVRGILCDFCNKGAGLLRDDKERALNMALYLESPFAYGVSLPEDPAPTGLSAVDKFRLRTYGLTPAQIDFLHEKQGFTCAACDDSEPAGRGWFVDHCHTSGRVRGVVCHFCNTAAGFLRDDPDRALAMAVYLEREGSP